MRAHPGCRTHPAAPARGPGGPASTHGLSPLPQRALGRAQSTGRAGPPARRSPIMSAWGRADPGCTCHASQPALGLSGTYADLDPSPEELAALDEVLAELELDELDGGDLEPWDDS